MTRTRLVLIAMASTLIILATACGPALDGGGDDGEYAALPNENILEDASASTSFGAEASDEFDAVGAGQRLSAQGGDIAPGAPPANPQLQNVLDRKIIQSTSVDIEVEEVGGSFQEIIRITETAGGFVASSSFSNRDEEQIADVTIRVPGNQYRPCWPASAAWALSRQRAQTPTT